MPLQLGLDSGHAGLRKIAAEVRWGGATVVSAPSRAAHVVMAASSAGLTFRALSFPFADRRRLEIMVAQELEHSLGFPPGQAAWDFVARPPLASGAENVYVVACPRTNLDAVLASAGDMRPAVVDAEPYAYQRVLMLAGIKDGIVADFGASHTTFCRIQEGHVDYVRVLLRGGNDLDALIAKKHGGRVEAARILKEEKGMAMPEAREFFDRLVSDALLPPEPEEAAMYVTGGGARTRGLAEWLNGKTARAVKTMPVPQGVDPYTEVVALGMALWGMRGSEGMNLHVVKETKSYARLIAALLLLIVAFITADVYVHKWSLTREYDRNVDAVRTIARDAVAGGNVQDLDGLRNVVEERKGNNKGGGRNVEQVLLQISEAVKEALAKEKSGTITINDVGVGTDIRLKGTASGYPAVDALISTLQAHFGEVDATKQNDPSGGVSFTIVVKFK